MEIKGCRTIQLLRTLRWYGTIDRMLKPVRTLHSLPVWTSRPVVMNVLISTTFIIRSCWLKIPKHQVLVILVVFLISVWPYPELPISHRQCVTLLLRSLCLTWILRWAVCFRSSARKRQEPNVGTRRFPLVIRDVWQTVSVLKMTICSKPD